MNVGSTIILAAAAILVQARPAAAQERFSLPDDRIAIYNLVGTVHIERGTGANVVVEVKRDGKHADRLDIQRTVVDGWSALIVQYPDDDIVYPDMGRFSKTEVRVGKSGIFGTSNLSPELGAARATARANTLRQGNRVRISRSGRGLDARADLHIRVPDGKAVAVHVGVGRVDVSGGAADLQIDARSASVTTARTTGFLRIDTGSGRIGVSEASGDIALNSGSGSVHAVRIGGGIAVLHTGSGGVQLEDVKTRELAVSTGSGSIVASAITAPALKFSTGSGSIRAHRIASEKFDLNTGSGSIQLDLLADLDAGRVQTGSGGVTITTTRAVGAEVTLDTGSGGIEVNGPVQVIEQRRSFFRGRLGDGAGTLRVGTGSGSIHLN